VCVLATEPKGPDLGLEAQDQHALHHIPPHLISDDGYNDARLMPYIRVAKPYFISSVFIGLMPIYPGVAPIPQTGLVRPTTILPTMPMLVVAGSGLEPAIFARDYEMHNHWAKRSRPQARGPRSTHSTTIPSVFKGLIIPINARNAKIHSHTLHNALMMSWQTSRHTILGKENDPAKLNRGVVRRSNSPFPKAVFG
jgi:hypothetical protein